MPTVAQMLGIDKEPPNWKPNSRQLYIHASYAGWKTESVKDLMRTYFKKEHSADLTWNEWSKLMGWIDKLPPNTIAVEKDKNTIDLFGE